MNKKIILITFLFLISFLKVFCKIDIDNTIVISNETYLSYQIPLGSENISSIIFYHYDRSPFQLDFECSNSKNSNSTTCFTTIDDEEKKQMYGGKISYNHERSMDRALFPTPIISSPFRPPTKGGELVIKGTYLTFFERASYYQIIYPKSQIINIFDFQLSSFDPTNVNVQFPPGCGYQLIEWENGKVYNFSYEKPSISNIKTTSPNIIVNGSNFCDKSYPSNITIDGNLIQSSNIEKDQDSIIIKYNEKYATKSKIIIETSNCTSIETIFEFKPDQLTINSVPINKGGLILINGIRLSPNPANKIQNNISIKIGNLTCFNVISISSELISCTLSQLNKSISNNIKNDLPVSVSINEITNENKLIFNYNTVRLNPNKYSLPNRVLQLNGDCLGNSNDTIVYLNGKEVILKDLEINYNETVLSFKIPDEYQSKLNVSVKVNNVMSNEIQIDISFYVSLSNISPSTYENTNIILTLYNIKPENYNKLPTLIINSEDQISINGVSLNSTNQEVHSYSFLIPVGCGKKEITIKIGTQSCLSSISYIEPIISNCKVSGYDGKSGEIICVGNFGNQNYLSQSYVLFSNNKISPPLINSTTLSFPLISGYHSDDLILEMCEIPSKSFKLNISPSLKRIDASNVNTNGGLFYIFGEFFNSNINSSVFCNDIPYQGIFENTTSIIFELPIQGPNDIMCNYSFNNGMNYSDFQVEYPKPMVENISTIYAIGGNLTIYGNNFYNISNITIEVNNQLQCNNIEFINLTTITCNLPPINETIHSSIFSQKLLKNTTTTIFSKKLLLKITFESKSWSGNIFQYSKDEIQYYDSENSSGKTLNDSTNQYNKENNGNGINMSIKNIVLICTLVPSSIIIVVFSVMIFLRIRRKRIEQINYLKSIKKRNYLSQEQKEKNRSKAKEVDDEIQKKIFENKCFMLQYATRNATYRSTVAWMEKELKKQEDQLKNDNIEASSSGQNQQQDLENKNETTSQLPPPPQLQQPSSLPSPQPQPPSSPLLPSPLPSPSPPLQPPSSTSLPSPPTTNINQNDSEI
ncbi:immunoglobulin E-set domain-containing protein [Dictyostelium discoideum AX4]|uniref:Immunoglobulin E-set domain-containing protein n=1 Tax=Dictyostelium discoideum TaxID=44689 RepID=Q55GQ0_DICDI|nr:immunoglobulin E-set domain-containing protein [Dictyostelium discoideum AX4]EAL73595.1 immunoglobulin E-set domain-containing protein [Dictyostelium discoideum AX4]|eukprot:XP_647134.1 immunoglobulin E-set domain-containing protein [Dictyostelium discoideum AX4]